MTCLVFTNLILALGQSHAFPKSMFLGVCAVRGSSNQDGLACATSLQSSLLAGRH